MPPELLDQESRTFREWLERRIKEAEERVADAVPNSPTRYIFSGALVTFKEVRDAAEVYGVETTKPKE